MTVSRRKDEIATSTTPNPEPEPWETAAAEFGQHASGWRLRFLAASCAENVGRGANPHLRIKVPGKVPAETFAERAGVGGDTVLRALKQWVEAYNQGAPIPYIGDLVPGQEIDLAVVEAWEPPLHPGAKAKEPFTVANDLLCAAGKRVLSVRKVDELSEDDCQALEKPLTDLESCISDVREFLAEEAKAERPGPSRTTRPESFKQACGIITALTEKTLTLIDIEGLTEQDRADLEEPLINGLLVAVMYVWESLSPARTFTGAVAKMIADGTERERSTPGRKPLTGTEPRAASGDSNAKGPWPEETRGLSLRSR